MQAASTGAITMDARLLAIFHRTDARCSCTSGCGEMPSKGSTSCAGRRRMRFGSTAPVRSAAARSVSSSDSAALLSATRTTTGAWAACAKSGMQSARAVAVSPETRRRPRARLRCRRTRSKLSVCSMLARASRTKGRTMLLRFYGLFVKVTVPYPLPPPVREAGL